MIIFISCSSQPTPIETFQIHPILDPQLNQIKQDFLSIYTSKLCRQKIQIFFKHDQNMKQYYIQEFVT